MKKTIESPAVPLNKRDSRRVIMPLALASLLALVTVGLAGVPQPDAVFYGTVTINGQVITAADNVTVIGRVSGSSDPVGRYRMGEGATAGSNYVLRVRLEVPVAGSPQNPNAARLGQVLQFFVKQGNNPEVLASSAPLTAAGMLELRNLSISFLPANCVADGVVDLADHQAFKNCMAGPGNVTAGQCSCADVEGDDDVDLRDWAWLQTGFTGP